MAKVCPTGPGGLTRASGIGLLAVGALLLSACSGAKSSDVPTLESPVSVSGEASTARLAVDLAAQKETAEALRDCLTDHGIAAVVGPAGAVGPEGQFYAVTPVPAASSFFYQVPGAGEGTEEYNQLLGQTERDALVLIDGGRDLSATLRQCVVTSGYYLPGPEADPAAEAQPHLDIGLPKDHKDYVPLRDLMLSHAPEG